MPRRREALTNALAAYDRGDVFLAHELLEPAWMGTAEPLERELYQGLIKLAAAGVHEVRGNPAGEAKNLRGALARLEATLAGGGPDAGLDLAALCASMRGRLAALGDAVGSGPTTRPRGRGPDASAPTITLPRRGG